MEREIIFYVEKSGKTPFLKWLETLDKVTQARIRNRITHLELGNFGDCKSMGEGVFELRLSFGPGYRIYFGEIGKRVVLLIHGGDKSTQPKDIERAKAIWRNYEK